MTNIERIDQACWETYQRYQGRYSNPNKIYEHLSYALSEGLRSNFSGFTRQNGARELVISMEPHEFEAEFLKALVRSVSYKRETMDPEYGKGTITIRSKAHIEEKNGSEIAKEVAEAPEVMKLRMDTLKKVLQFEDPTIFCRFSEQTRNKKEIYSIALKRMPELKVYVNQ